MTQRARLVIIAIAVVALVIAFVVASGSGDKKKAASSAPESTAAPAASTTTTAGGGGTTAQATPAAPPTPATPVVTVVGAKPLDGVQRLKFTKGDRVRFAVQSDTADEIHVHGYDFHKNVPAGGTARFSFPATIDGRFVVELEQHGTQIAQLEVTP